MVTYTLPHVKCYTDAREAYDFGWICSQITPKMRSKNILFDPKAKVGFPLRNA